MRSEYTVKWQEQNTAASEDKCERIVIHVHYEDSSCDILLFVIGIFLTTGRIQIQGNFCQEWASNEMPLLLPIVNKGSAERMLRNITDYGDFFYNKTTTKLESNGKDYITDIPENITENDTNDQENEPSKASATETTTDTLAE